MDGNLVNGGRNGVRRPDFKNGRGGVAAGAEKKRNKIGGWLCQQQENQNRRRIAADKHQRAEQEPELEKAFIRKHKERLDCIDVVIPEGEEKQRLWKVLEKEVEDIYITSSVPQLLEIAYKEAGKAPAVQFLLERLGISRCELAAFGDGDNDCALLEYAGLGIAVENACKSCLAAADRVTASNDKDGVAIEIEKFLEG